MYKTIVYTLVNVRPHYTSKTANIRKKVILRSMALPKCQWNAE